MRWYVSQDSLRREFKSVVVRNALGTLWMLGWGWTLWMCLIRVSSSCNITLKDFGWLDVFFFFLFWSTTTDLTDLLTSCWHPPSQAHWQRGRGQQQEFSHLHTTRFEPRTLVRYFSREEEYDDICPPRLTPLFIHKRWWMITHFVCFFYSLFLICHWFFSMLVIMCFWHFEYMCTGFKAWNSRGFKVGNWKDICCCPLQNVL